jgi:hypothetical protein
MFHTFKAGSEKTRLASTRAAGSSSTTRMRRRRGVRARPEVSASSSAAANCSGWVSLFIDLEIGDAQAPVTELNRAGKMPPIGIAIAAIACIRMWKSRK